MEEKPKKKKRSLLELANDSLKNFLITKKEFGRIMHDPTASAEQVADALAALESEGYENLPD